MGQLRIMGMEGDVKVEWDSDTPAEVKQAKKTFEELKEKGYLAYKVKEDMGKGRKGELIDKFDPDAERIIMAPKMVGG